MSVCHKELNKFRIERRKSEYDILIKILPNVISDVIITYAQFDDELPTRMENVRTRIYGIKIFIGLKYSSDDNDEVQAFHLEMLSNSFNRIRMIFTKYHDILTACYNDGYVSRFTHDIVINIHSIALLQCNEIEMTYSLVEREIIDFIRWPITHLRV